MIPLFVECAGKRVVIFGGGEVAARKAGHFAREADVLVVSRTFTPSCRSLPVHLQTLDTRAATDAEARAAHRTRVPRDRCAFRAVRERPDWCALPGSRCALQQRGRDSRRRGHPGHFDRGVLHGCGQHGKQEPCGLPVYPAGD